MRLADVEFMSSLDRMPEVVRPMLAQLSSLPPREENWGFEYKWDGVRATCYWRAGRLRLASRNLLDITSQYPELLDMAAHLSCPSLILDGEIVALDAHGKISFGQLQRRMHVVNPIMVARRRVEIPVHYMIFDVLYKNGRSLMPLPYRQRREALAELALDGPYWRTPPWQRHNGEAMYEAALANGLEGVVAKRLDSPYEPGQRSPAWRKIKSTHRQEFVIAGYLPYRGQRGTGVGSLLLGYYDGQGRLVYAGKVGTGFSEPDRMELMRRLDALARKTSPFEVGHPEPDALFAHPRLVGEVKFLEWTREGSVRHPSFLGLRFDKQASEVVRELPPK